jgi:hypothetical protein
LTRFKTLLLIFSYLSSFSSQNIQYKVKKYLYKMIKFYIFFSRIRKRIAYLCIKKENVSKGPRNRAGSKPGNKTTADLNHSVGYPPDAKLLRCLAPADAHKSACALMTCSSWGTVLDACLKHLTFLSFHSSQLVRAKRESRPHHLSGVVA